jgi:CheY-like chemotaxis protein
LKDVRSPVQEVTNSEKGPGRRTPAPALTGYARESERERALLAGFDARLPKPVDAEEPAAGVIRLTTRTA